MQRHMDLATFLVALMTLVLFVAALFTKGITHDLFLEAGVFLVSVKIIVMAYKNSVAIGILSDKLDTILTALTNKTNHGSKKEDDTQDRSVPGE
jgi:hypothetical protein